jgi:methanogenic corrinoid protein MtbC1
MRLRRMTRGLQLQSRVYLKQRPTTSADPPVAEYAELTANDDASMVEYTLNNLKGSNTVSITYEQKRANGNQQVAEQYVADQVFLPTDEEKDCYTVVVKSLIDELCFDGTVHSTAAVVLMGQSGNAHTAMHKLNLLVDCSE